MMFFFVLQGHCAPILYAAWAEAGAFPVSDLLNLRKIDSDLEGHPTPVGSSRKTFSHNFFSLILAIEFH
jgi:transketolase N-terminal domain/subunit